MQAGQFKAVDSVGGKRFVGVGRVDDEGVTIYFLCSIEEVGVFPGVVVVGDLDLGGEVPIAEAHDESFLKIIRNFNISD